ncbi:MAG: acyl-CoA carboxylase subunit beta [Anaerolineae bacterium]|nr:acyl-CoA carboxylase subunit beta [Anaerolineae bacterium]
MSDPRLEKLAQWRQKVLEGGGADRIERQHAKGKLTARERVTALLDAGTFNELEPFVTLREDELDANPSRYPGDGVVTGYGQIDGRTVYLYAQDFTVYGGTLAEMHAQKICRVMDLALRNGTPIIGLIDSGGARIQDGVRALHGYGEVFRRNAVSSGVVPQISVMLGPCAGGAAYSPALTDFIIMVEGTSFSFITGPNVIRAVTGEKIDSESLGGAKTHNTLSGVAHFDASSEVEALGLCRRLLSYLPSNNVENPPHVEPPDDPWRMDPALNDVVPLDDTTPYDMREVIERVVDLGTFMEVQAGWAQNAIVGFARLGGHVVGMVAQQPMVMAGVMDINSSDKICRFVRFCDCFNIPLVTFVDSPGFLPGVAQEHGGIIRHGAKALYAYIEATVPKISIITRKAYGGAYVVMSSKGLGTDINYAWPSAEIAVMGPSGAANILYHDEIESADDPAATHARLVKEYRETFANPYRAAEAGFLDDIIEPRQTRPKLIAALGALRDQFQTTPPKKHGNMPV